MSHHDTGERIPVISTTLQGYLALFPSTNAPCSGGVDIVHGSAAFCDGQSFSHSIFWCILAQVDSRYSTLRSRLPSWENRGLLLRWASSLANMEAVKSIPKKKLNAFVGRSENALKASEMHLLTLATI